MRKLWALHKEQMALLLKLELLMQYCRSECSCFNSWLSTSCLSSFRDHELMIHVCVLCIQLQDREALCPRGDGPSNNGNAWFNPKVYAIVHDAKKYPFAAMMDFRKWVLERSMSWGIRVMTNAGWKIITLEDLKKNREKNLQ
jgi:hypothetical protein